MWSTGFTQVLLQFRAPGSVAPRRFASNLCVTFCVQLVILDAHGRKKAEQAAFKAALAEALAERDQEARGLLVGYEKAKKMLLRAVAARPADTEEQVRQAVQAAV